MDVSISSGRIVDDLGRDEGETVDVIMGMRYGARGMYV